MLSDTETSAVSLSYELLLHHRAALCTTSRTWDVPPRFVFVIKKRIGKMPVSLKKTLFVLLAVVLGVSMAWIRPAQPLQVEAAAVSFDFGGASPLDNANVPAEDSLHNSRKCTYEARISARTYILALVLVPLTTLSTLSLSLCVFSIDPTGGFCMGVSRDGWHAMRFFPGSPHSRTLLCFVFHSEPDRRTAPSAASRPLHSLFVAMKGAREVRIATTYDE
jgi:hypothetical protein